MNKKVKFVVVPISLIILMVVAYLFIFTAPINCTLSVCGDSTTFDIPKSVFEEIYNKNITVNFENQSYSIEKDYWAYISNNTIPVNSNATLEKLKEIKQIRIVDDENNNEYILELKDIEQNKHYPNGRMCGGSCTSTIFYFEE